MRDFDIRKSLRDQLERDHAQEPDTAIIDELAVCQGDARIDVAVVNGSLNGYEIKSEHDTLERLISQRDVYNRCFDTITLVAAEKHIQHARSIVPKWWGITQPLPAENGRVLFKTIRRAKPNRLQEAAAIVQLLWREEAIAVLAPLRPVSTIRKMRRLEMWQLIAEQFTLDYVKDRVREAIKARGDWRSEKRRVQDNDSSPTSATTEHSLSNLQWLLSYQPGDPLH